MNELLRELEWDPYVEGWIVKDMPDGRRVWIKKFTFTAAIIIGPDGTGMYDDRWCYATAELAATCARAWDAMPGTEPTGWHRHPTSGRRRPEGNPHREYLMA